MLCGIFINNQIALGLKDGTIYVCSTDGHSIATMKEHQAGICSLAVVRNKASGKSYLASGSDVGCSRVIFWDPTTWQPKYIFNSHQAAVTGIVDLQDDTHVLSAGYDKKMVIYNLDEGRIAYSAIQTEFPLTSITTNKTASKLIASCLDKAIYIFEIQRNFKLKI